jgi:hypothetical protein
VLRQPSCCLLLRQPSCRLGRGGGSQGSDLLMRLVDVELAPPEMVALMRVSEAPHHHEWKKMPGVIRFTLRSLHARCQAQEPLQWGTHDGRRCVNGSGSTDALLGWTRAFRKRWIRPTGNYRAKLDGTETLDGEPCLLATLLPPPAMNMIHWNRQRRSHHQFREKSRTRKTVASPLPPFPPPRSMVL